ncbi:MAG TPA: MFS transporter [Myxococcota bacterium]|nr:MFS transporter [Myxococcota bacterium]
MDASPDKRRRNPWWIPPFLGRVPADVPEHHLRLLGGLAFALYFEFFDQGLLTQAIKQIAADFGVLEREIGQTMGFVRLGALPAFFLLPLADRIGRRRLFLLSVAGMSLGTLSAGVSTSITAFIGFQMFARMCMVTASATAFVIAAEEMAAQHRGWAIGLISAVGGAGFFGAAVLFAFIDVLPFGWRTMYGFGVVPLLLLPWLGRRVPETRRFTLARGSEAGLAAAAGWWRPLADLFGALPLRALGVGLIGWAQSVAAAVAFQFSSYFVQERHGWEPGDYTLMLGIGGILGVLGYPLAGRTGDRRGRRTVGVTLLVLMWPLVAAYYAVPGWLVPVAFVPMIFTLTGSETIIRALAVELFPTALRGTASGWYQLCSTLGAGTGLFATTFLTPEGDSAIPTVQWVAGCAWIAALAVWFMPETSGRELEEISA